MSFCRYVPIELDSISIYFLNWNIYETVVKNSMHGILIVILNFYDVIFTEIYKKCKKNVG